MSDDARPVYEPHDDQTQPAMEAESYFRTSLFAPTKPAYKLERTISELTGPVYSQNSVKPEEADLSVGPTGPAIGQLIRVAGRVTDEDGRPVENALLEVWQANAAGKYPHIMDDRDAPMDPNFDGAGRVVTDADGRYMFTTIKPGAYPVPNTGNWWRPPHIHFSLYGASFLTRLITQMYFPGDPLNDIDGILGAIPDAAAQDRLIAKPNVDIGLHEHALGFEFDIVLRGHAATPFENGS